MTIAPPQQTCSSPPPLHPRFPDISNFHRPLRSLAHRRPVPSVPGAADTKSTYARMSHPRGPLKALPHLRGSWSTDCVFFFDVSDLSALFSLLLLRPVSWSRAGCAWAGWLAGWLVCLPHCLLHGVVDASGAMTRVDWVGSVDGSVQHGVLEDKWVTNGQDGHAREWDLNGMNEVDAFVACMRALHMSGGSRIRR